MLRIAFLNKCTLCILIIVLSSCHGRNPKIESSRDWKVVTIRQGIEYRSLINQSFNENQQTIHVLTVDLTACDCELQLAYDSIELQKTSYRGRHNNAIASINGNFFNPEKGGSVCFLRVDNQLINATIPDKEELLFLPMLDEGAIGLEAEDVMIVEKPINGWPLNDGYRSIMSSGPLLIKDREILPQEDIEFMSDSHARSAFGINNQTLFLVVVDGYNQSASGMTMADLALLMYNLGCEDAINLDGGGSSTLWINSNEYDGVVNYPSDNNRFDHNGERNVANSIIVVPK